jgi:hypothetical protein
MKKIIFTFIITACGLMSVAQNLPAYLPADGLVAWYPFNGNANDESGNGNNGVVNGATLTNDRNGNVNGAYNFDGINDYISVLSSDILNFGEGVSFTISLHFLPGAIITYPNGFNGIIGKCFATGVNPPRGWQIGRDVNNIRIESIGGNDIINPSNNSFCGDNNIWNITNGENKHLVFIFDRMSNSLKCYINSELIHTLYCSDLFRSYNNDSPLLIGVEREGSQYTSGIIDDIAIYNRALTPEEITALYTSTPVNGGGGSTSGNSVPPGIPYQAVVRNANGSVAANAAVNTRFTLHQNTADGVVEYQETHTVTTNAQGLMATVLGQGTAVQNTFAAINWANTTKFLQVEVDLWNGYVDLGTQQLMSVPYAMYAANGPAGPQGPAGPAGEQGLQGPEGQSAYEVWLGQGNTGTEQEFIQSMMNNPGNSTNQIKYWDGSNWVLLNAGNEGEILSIQNGNLSWVNSQNISAPLELRQVYQGGYIFYFFQPGDEDYVEGEVHGLIAAQIESSSFLPWGSNQCNASTVGTSNVGIGWGESNTSSIVSYCGSNSDYAAKYCQDLNFGGYSDWYLPSFNELVMISQNLVAWNIGGLATVGWDTYWSSSEFGALQGISRAMGTPADIWGQSQPNKTELKRVKPIRKF